MKRRMILVLAISLLFGTIVLGVGATSPAKIFGAKVTCRPALPDGTVVLVNIGGPNCNCPHPAVSGTASGGAVVVNIDLGDCRPNNDCFFYAATSFGTPEKIYKGNDRIVPGLLTEVKMTEKKP